MKNSFKPLKPLDEAWPELLNPIKPVKDIERIQTLCANGRVLADAVHSLIDVPPMNNSQMDGYAVRINDIAEALKTGNTLPITQRIAAGQTPQPLEAGSVARIFTGAPLLAGADAVLMQEQVELIENTEDIKHVRPLHQPQLGEFIRWQGEDVRRDALVLSPGVSLGPAELGLIASIGVAEINVYRRVRVAIFFTGDELIMPGEHLPFGSIYNSNRFVLRALLENLGCDITDLGIIPDNFEATRAALCTAAQGHDLIITSGGVSVGEEDHIKPAVEAEGQLKLWQLAIKPGKPLAFGAIKETHFLGLPGNPVASLITFMVCVRPIIQRLQGRLTVSPLPKPIKLRACFDLPRPDKRREFLRAQRINNDEREIFKNQGSAILTSAVWADGLIDHPAGQTIQKGDWVNFLPFSDLLR